MSRRKITVGSESVMIPIFAQDTSSTTGAGLGSLVYNTAGLAAKYRREGQNSWTTITLATATVGTYTSGGFIADGGPVTGGYEFCPPDAAVASGVRWVQIDIYGAANMLPVLLELELDTVNYQATNGKLPVTLDASDVTGNVPADLQTIKTQTITCAAGVTVGAYVGGTGAAALEATAQTILADTNELQTDWANNGRLDLILDARASQTSLDALVTTVGVAGAGLTEVQLPSNGLANVTAWTVAITGNITGNLSGSVGSVTGAVGSVASAITLPTIPTNWITADGIATDAFGALELSAGAASEIATAVDSTLSGTHGAGSWLTGSSGGGTGARSVTITVNDGSTALQNALVRMSQGAESYVVATNVSGVAAFSLDDATWTVTITKAGYSFTPTTLVVDGTETETYSMTAVTITPSESDRTTCYLTIQTMAGVAVSAQPVTLEYVGFQVGDTGEGVSVPSVTNSTNASGLVQFVNIHRLARYRVKVGDDGPWIEGRTADAATTPLVNAMGAIEV